LKSVYDFGVDKSNFKFRFLNYFKFRNLGSIFNPEFSALDYFIDHPSLTTVCPKFSPSAVVYQEKVVVVLWVRGFGSLQFWGV